MNYKDAIQAQITAFNYVAPSGKEQQALVKMLKDMQQAGESEKEQLLALTAALYDGLAYGNWPGLVGGVT